MTHARFERRMREARPRYVYSGRLAAFALLAGVGFAAGLVVVLGGCAAAVVGALVAAMVLAAFPWLHGKWVLWRFLKWPERGDRVLLVVWSGSPVWREHIAREWLPRLGDRAVVLDWSRRSEWTPSPATALFQRFGGETHFNPLVIRLRRLGRPEIFRFYGPFQLAKHGDRTLLEETERRVFRQ